MTDSQRQERSPDCVSCSFAKSQQTVISRTLIDLLTFVPSICGAGNVSVCGRLIVRPLAIGSLSSCSAFDDGKISVVGTGLERRSLVELCTAIGEPAALGNVEIVSHDKIGTPISAGCQVDAVPPHLMHPTD